MKKGFTLIELLAVLVILAIIALIAVPIVQNMIRDSRKNATLRSAEFYIDAVNKSIASKQASIDFDLNDGTYKINEQGNICLDEECTEIFEVEVENTRPTSGSVDIENNRVVSVSNLYFPKNKYNVSTVDGNLVASKEQITRTYESGDVVYFDVESGEPCTESKYKESIGEYETFVNPYDDLKKTVTDYGNSKSGYNGIDNKDENQNSCLKFYVVGSVEDRVTLILDHNTTINIDWNTIDDMSSGPSSEFLLQLKNDTKKWKGTLTPENYNCHVDAQCYDEACGDEIDYTIDYSSYTSRILSMEEVINVMGITTVDIKKIFVGWGTVSFSENNLTTSEVKSKNYWIADRLLGISSDNSNAITDDDPGQGYYTSTVSLYTWLSSNGTPSVIKPTIWSVQSFRLRHVAPIYNALGIRPVIEVSKDKL